MIPNLCVGALNEQKGEAFGFVLCYRSSRYPSHLTTKTERVSGVHAWCPKLAIRINVPWGDSLRDCLLTPMFSIDEVMLWTELLQFTPRYDDNEVVTRNYVLVQTGT